jgi:type IV pilus biogenesis protein PilP
VEVPPAPSLLSDVKITPASAQPSSNKSSKVAQAPKTKTSGKEKKETQAKSAPSKTAIADAKATLQPGTQTAKAAPVVSSAPTVAAAAPASGIKSEIKPAKSAMDTISAEPPSKAKLLTAPVQAKLIGLMAATTSCRAEPRSEKIFAPTVSAQIPDRQAELKSGKDDRSSGAIFSALMSHAVNPLATGTALANSSTLSTNATQMISEGKISPKPAQAPEQAAFPASFPQGSLGQMAKLRAELEQLKLQVHIEEVRQRLNQLKDQTSPTPRAPSLEFPPIGMPGPATDPAGESPRKALRLLSIQSLNGKYTATLGTDSGPRVVRSNETVDGYRVVSISRNSVVINRGKGNEMLSIYE